MNKFTLIIIFLFIIFNLFHQYVIIKGYSEITDNYSKAMDKILNIKK